MNKKPGRPPAMKKENSVEDKHSSEGLLIPPALQKGGTDAKPLTIQEKLMKDAQKLVRIQVACLNPLKSDYSAVIISGGNSVMPTETKTIPLNTPWHVPRILVDILKNKKFQVFHETKDETGKTIKKTVQTPEFAVQELPPLNEDELAALAKRQLASQSGEALNAA